MSDFTITQTFWLSDRGLVAALNALLPPNTSRKLRVEITRADGTNFETSAVVELLCQSVTPLREVSALLLPELPRDAVQAGFVVRLAPSKVSGSPN